MSEPTRPMSEYDLIGHGHVISLNKSETVGVMLTEDITDNQTRRSVFDVNYLREAARNKLQSEEN